MSGGLFAGLGAGFSYLCGILCYIGVEKWKKRKAHQQDDIYNISGRVQNQEQWPTHDAHLSIDHISVLNQMNKPVYDDAPPSYEEVMKTSIQVVGETSTPPYSPPQPPSQVVIVVPPTTRSQ
uniref:Uncharacterized protein LOC114328718 isoform X10 n=1 Tax=Diabrotica virgifera virgifera TaxID=50390 RepID=A0A6P7FF24_DIAVI